MSFSLFTMLDLKCQSRELWAIVLNLTPPTGENMLGKYFFNEGSDVSK